MVRAALVALVVVGWLAPGAVAAPAARQRVVLADPDPELRHAMEQALAPWQLEVVIEGSAPTDTAMAQERADADTARFVVWRDGDQLVVYDRELGFLERRDSRAGVLDPPTAAAAALTIKTMMRLPPPPSEAPPAPLAAAPEPGIELRLQAGIATRITRGATDSGSMTDASARLSGVAQIRPWADWGLRFGIAADAGTATAVDRASFKGTWSEWGVLGLVSWTHAIASWEFEPHAGAGFRRGVLDGAEMQVLRSESATLANARAGLWVRWRLTRWTFGAALDVDDSFATPTYSKTNSPAEVFQVPAIGVELGAVIAVEL